MPLIWFILVYVFFLVFCAWLFTRVFLIGRSMRRYDSPRTEIPPERRTASPQSEQVVRRIEDFQRAIRKTPKASRLTTTRRLLDAGIAGTPVTPESLRVHEQVVDADGVAAEWIWVPESDPDRRLLYIHGGALMAGSPSSHRAITAELARRASLSVLAIDYRLMPENPRSAILSDCKTAYQWMLHHGREGEAPAQSVYVAGDSAGGNLTLVLIAWLRDAALRQADAAVALSPLTDATLTSPTMRSNIPTDPFLGPSMGRLMRLPRTVLAYLTLFTNRLTPKNPELSPLRGNLAELPPTLLHASATEMLYDDAQRYLNKALEAGSPTEFQVWNEMVHVWHLFHPVLPESSTALDEIASFVQRHPGHSKPDR